MRKALAQAGLEPSAIAHVNAHATGTPVGDAGEARAIGEVFGRATVTAPKAAMGHLFGAAGAVEAIVAVLRVDHRVPPPTRIHRDPEIDPAIDPADFVARSARPTDERHGNMSGFGRPNVAPC